MTLTQELIEIGAAALAEYDAPRTANNWGKLDNDERRAYEAAYRRRSEACLKAVFASLK